MKRYYYGAAIISFISEESSSIFGKLAQHHSHDLEELQKNSWLSEIEILKNQLSKITDGYIFLEFSIPRMGKRVDSILIVGDFVFVIEFKVGTKQYEKHAIDQVVDYAIDLKNFHEGSHFIKIVPVLIATEAPDSEISFHSYPDKLFYPIRVNKNQITSLLTNKIIQFGISLNPIEWAESRYKPTPTIIEVAHALYAEHKVEEITRRDAGVINLSDTSNCINKIIDTSIFQGKKTICFVTGVPGAGKTLAGLDLAIQRKNKENESHAVFLSGNGPLVDVLREALTRDKVARVRANGLKIIKADAYRETSSFIQNIHHFRDDAWGNIMPPIEKVVVFDEAQRAWTKKKRVSL